MTMTDYHFNNIVNATKKLKEHVEAVEKENDRLKKGLVGEVREIKEVPWAKFWRGQINYESDALRFLPNNFSSPKEAYAKADELYQESLVIVEENDGAAKANKEVLDNIVRAFSVLGLKTTYRKYKGSSLKYTELQTEWYKELRNVVQTSVPLDKNKLDSEYSQLKRHIQIWDVKQAQAKQMEERRVADEEKKLKADRLTGILAQKYGLELTADGREVRDAILERDKYLRLAYWLERNRGDWTDGSNFAEVGLAEFVVETENDKQIEQEISYLIENWDGDGRCFRDCGWNYDRIRDLADPSLVSDLAALVASGALDDTY